MSLVVAKFGGTSMGSSESIQQVSKIIQEKLKNDFDNVVTVASATSGTTDQLIELGKLALEKGNWSILLMEIRQKHEEICKELGLKIDLSSFWQEMNNLVSGISLIGELSLSARDRLMTFGERISNTILAEYLNSQNLQAEMIDAYEIVRTDNNFGEGRVNFEATKELINSRIGNILNSEKIPVVTGFVAQAENGQYITLGRGGSDYTGAILASCLKADELQIWTDVDGILNIDPRLVPEAKVLDQLSFNEASELAYFGAKVLHPKTIKPAVAENIPVRILNTFNIDAEGSVITNEEVESIKSVTYKKGISIVNICSAELLEAHGFLAKIFEVFGRHNVVVDVVSTSEVSVSLTVDENVPEIAFEELREFANVDFIEGMAIVCLVGEGIKGNSRVLGELFNAIEDHDVSMVSQGASKRNITFLVEEDEVKDIVKKVYGRFFQEIVREHEMVYCGGKSEKINLEKI